MAMSSGARYVKLQGSLKPQCQLKYVGNQLDAFGSKALKAFTLKC